MGVSATGAKGLSMFSIQMILIVITAAFGLTFYFYGPAITPVMQAAAVTSCNDLMGGNFRSYHLEWVAETEPHWNCWDKTDPSKGPIDMGWWVTPER